MRIKDYLGSKSNPCRNNSDLLTAMKGRRDCIIYTRGIFKISETVYDELKTRNIELMGIGYLYY